MTTLALVGLSLADSRNMHDGWGGVWMMPRMVGMVLFWGAIIFGFFWLARHAVEPRQQRPEETALTVLDRRFAEGALSADEYQQRRSVLAATKAPRAESGGRSPASEDI